MDGSLQFPPGSQYGAAAAPAPTPVAAQQPVTYPALNALAAQQQQQQPMPPAVNPSAPPMDQQPAPERRTHSVAMSSLFVLGLVGLTVAAARKRPPHFGAACLPLLPFGFVVGVLFSGIDRSREHSFLKARVKSFGEGNWVVPTAVAALLLFGLKRYPKSAAIGMGAAAGFMLGDAAGHGLMRLTSKA